MNITEWIHNEIEEHFLSPQPVKYILYMEVRSPVESDILKVFEAVRDEFGKPTETQLTFQSTVHNFKSTWKLSPYSPLCLISNDTVSNHIMHLLVRKKLEDAELTGLVNYLVSKPME